MGKPWLDHPSWAVVERVGDAIGRDVAGLLTDADADTLRQTRNAQPATFTLSLVVLDAARRAGLLDAPVAGVAGHSLGEYSALVAVGVLSEKDAANVVAERGEAMQAASEAAPGTMAAILGLDAELVSEACSGVDGAWVANDNAPGQVVLAGTTAALDVASARARDLGAKRIVELPVGGAFHSPLMGPARSRLEAALSSVDWSAAAAPVVTNVDAAPHLDGFPALLSAGLGAPVRWRESLLGLRSLGADLWVELGPGSELSGMVKRTVEGARRVTLNSPDDLEGARVG